jgi:transposase-like protein
MVERRKFSPEFKARVVLELISGKKGLMEASIEYGIKDTALMLIITATARFGSPHGLT